MYILYHSTPNKMHRFFAFVVLLSTIAASTCQNEDEPKVLYYGWFFTEPVAESLKAVTDLYFNKSLEVPEFRDFLDNLSKEASVQDPWKYYIKPLDPNTQKYDPLYHVTANFCGLKDCSAYAEQIKPILNKQFVISLVGIYITPRTFGVRVSLTDDQKQYFVEDAAQTMTLMMKHPKLQSTFDTNLLNYPGIDFVDQPQDLHPTTNRAHVTIGCAPGIPAQVTGTDLEEIILLESSSTGVKINHTLDIGLMIQYGDNWDAAVVYLNQKMMVNLTFEAYANPTKDSSFVHQLNNVLLIASFGIMYFRRTL